MQSNDIFIDKTIDALLSDIENKTDKFYKRLIVYLDKFDTKGGVYDSSQYDLIIKLQKFIENEVFDKETKSKIVKYLDSYDQATGNIIKINQSFGNSVSRLNTNNLMSDAKKVALNSIGGLGFDKAITGVIQDKILNAINTNSSVDALTNDLKILIKPDNGVGLLEKHFGQVAKDSLYQYQGSINKKIIDIYDFKNIRYVPLTEINTTRPVCDKIVNICQDNGGKISIVELKSLLQIYCPQGTPNKAYTTYEIRGVEYRKQYGAGMIKGTSIDNFIVVRGGYNCRHSAIGAR